MKILDVFSWVPEQEISLEKLRHVFSEYMNSLSDNLLIVLTEEPKNISQNVVNVKTELTREGKQVAYILKNEEVIAVIGYME